MEVKSEAAPTPQSVPADEAKILRQMEFYFSDSNYPKDKFLRGQAAQNEEGWIPISVITTFPRMGTIGATVENVAQILRAKSKQVLVNEDGTQVKRATPLPEVDTTNARSVYTKGWNTAGITIENVEEKINKHGDHGKIACVRLRKKKYAYKPSVFIEFESEEAAKKFASLGEFTTSDGETITIKTKIQYFEDKKAKQKKRKSESGDDSSEKKSKVERKEDRDLPKQCVIVFKNCGTETTREDFKTYLTDIAKVAFVDFSKGSTEGKIRMQTPEDAEKALAKFKSEPEHQWGGSVATFEMLSGDAEDEYLKMVKADVQARSKEKGRGGKRGGRGGGRGGRGGRGGGKRQRF